MKIFRIEQEMKQLKYRITLYKYCLLFEFQIKFVYENVKYSLFITLSLFLTAIIIYEIFYLKKVYDLKPFKKYVRDCKMSKAYNREKIFNENPYISICISALNMENFIEKNLLSILNQSFQDFEIIIVNDASIDETENIIKRIQLDDKRIKLLSHNKTLGVYRSRIESILNSKSKYVILMDPDDMYLNENLFLELYNYNIKRNLDIIEFSVLQQIDGKNKIFLPDNDFESHYHNFNKSIIYQPELSNLLYYLPGTSEYSHTICRNIWNKMIRITIFIQTNNYIGKKYYLKNIITADDMMMNIITYQFANNYSNINLPGYLYIRRKKSMSRGGGKKIKAQRSKNFFFYFRIFYKYVKDYNKDINLLLYEIQNLERFILKLKEYNLTKYKRIQRNLIKQILKDNILSNDFSNYLQNLSFCLKN